MLAQRAPLVVFNAENLSTVKPKKNAMKDNHSIHVAVERAVESGETQELEQMLKAGMPANSADLAGNTALHTAVARRFYRTWVPDGAVHRAECLCRWRAWEIEYRRSSGSLYDDRLASRKQCVEVLLRFGPNVSAINRFGESPLHLAATCSIDSSLVALLLGAGADPNAQDLSGATPLHLAVWTASNSVVSALLAADANCNICDEDGTTPLLIAATGNDLEEIDSLVDKGARIDARNGRGATVLHQAMCCLGEAKTFRQSAAFRFLELGANVNARDGEGKTPLHYAVRNNGQESIEMLIRLGADVHARDGLGRTPLHEWAICGLQTSSLCALLHGGATVEAHDDSRQTPLHLVGSRCDDPDDSEIPTDDDGTFDWSSGEYLEFEELTEIADATEDILETLLAAGANLKALDCNGRTPWQTATNSQVRERLLQAMTMDSRGELRE